MRDGGRPLYGSILDSTSSSAASREVCIDGASGDCAGFGVTCSLHAFHLGVICQRLLSSLFWHQELLAQKNNVGCLANSGQGPNRPLLRQAAHSVPSGTLQVRYGKMQG
jgi:hypothetical protein